MTSPDDSDPVRSELEYAPPWVREQAAREQGTREPAPREQGAREQAAREPAPREPAPREQMTRDQFRAALWQSGGAAVGQRTQSNSESGVSVTIGPGISVRWSPSLFQSRRRGPRIIGR